MRDITIDVRATLEMRGKASKCFMSREARRKAVEEVMASHVVANHGAWEIEEDAIAYFSRNSATTYAKSRQALADSIDGKAMEACFEMLAQCRVPAKRSPFSIHMGTDYGSKTAHWWKDQVNNMRFHEGGGAWDGTFLVAAWACGIPCHKHYERHLSLLLPGYEPVEESPQMAYLRWAADKYDGKMEFMDGDYQNKARETAVMDAHVVVQEYDQGHNPWHDKDKLPKEVSGWCGSGHGCQEWADASWLLFLEFAAEHPLKAAPLWYEVLNYGFRPEVVGDAVSRIADEWYTPAGEESA